MISSRERRSLARGQAREGLVDEHDLRVARDRLGDLDLAQVGEGQASRAAGRARAPRPTRSAIARARASLSGSGKRRQQLVGQEREHDVLEHGLPVQRARMLEDHADAEAGDPVRRPARDLDAFDANRAGVRPLDAHDQLHHRRFAGAIRSDEAENFAAVHRKLMSLTATRPPKRLVRPFTSRWASSAGALMRPPRVRVRHAEKTAREEQDDEERHRRDDEGGEIAERPQRLAGADQEHRAQHRAEDGAPAAEHRPDDHLHADGDVDEGADRGRAEIEDHQRAGEPGEEGADDEGRELVLGDVEAERAGLHRVLAARLQDEADRRAREPVENAPLTAMKPSAIQ